jgi:hypothetical protein
MAKATTSAGLPGPRVKKHNPTKAVKTRPDGYRPRRKTGR